MGLFQRIAFFMRELFAKWGWIWRFKRRRRILVWDFSTA